MRPLSVQPLARGPWTKLHKGRRHWGQETDRCFCRPPLTSAVSKSFEMYLQNEAKANSVDESRQLFWLFFELIHCHPRRCLKWCAGQGMEPRQGVGHCQRERLQCTASRVWRLPGSHSPADQSDSSTYRWWEQDVSVGADRFLVTGHHFLWPLCCRDWPRSSWPACTRQWWQLQGERGWGLCLGSAATGMWLL